MKRNIIIALIISLGLLSLLFYYLKQSGNKIIEESILGDTIRQAAIDTSMQIDNDTLQIIGVAQQFLKWYKTNYKKANSFGFTRLDSKGNYMVDELACENYLQFLKSSGQISDSYVDDWQKYFKSKVEYFKQEPQNEGPPDGFGMDLVLLTQEPELILNAIDQLKFKAIEIGDTSAIMEVSGEFFYQFEMSKINGKWLIDYISTENYD